MTEIFDWWKNLPPIDQTFWAVGLVSNLLLLIHFALQFAGHDNDLNHDAPSSDADFSILSIRSLLAFGTFLGWSAGLVRQSGGSVLLALIAGGTAGFLAAWLAWRLVLLLLRLQSSGATLDKQKLVGEVATVYLTIPAGGQRTGKIMLTTQSALREFDALTFENSDLPTGLKVLVVEISEAGLPVVAPLDSTRNDFFSASEV